VVLTNIEGGYGKISTPIQPAISLYSTGTVHSRLIPPLPFFIATNGKVIPTSDPQGDQMGKASCLMFPDPLDERVVDAMHGFWTDIVK
jgi:hypothetical protein